MSLLNKVFLVILSLASLIAEAEISSVKAEEISQTIAAEFLEDLDKNGLVVNFRFDKAEKLPSAYARWINEEKVGEVSIDSRVLKFSETDELSFTMMLCHELGHFLGGRPYVKAGGNQGIFSFRNKYKKMSAEGQADWFATSVCFPRLYSKIHDEWSDSRWEKVCEASDRECHITYEAIDRNLKLYRKILLSSNGEDIGVTDILMETSFQVDETISKAGEYPTPQCRAKTMTSGFRASRDSINYFEPPSCWYRPLN